MSRKPVETRCLLVALLLFGGGTLCAERQAAAAEDSQLQMRIWTDSTGKHRTEAAMVKFADGKVHLRKRNGRTVTVSAGKLSRADRQYVREELARRKAASTDQPDTAGRAEGWPGWRGPRRDGKSPDKGLLKEWPPEGPKLLWKADGIGKGYSTVAVSNATVYTTGDLDGKLIVFAFGLDGKPKWKTNHGSAWTRDHPGSRSTPMIDGDRLYLISGNGLVGCLNANTGRQKWTRQMRDFGGSVPGWGYAESVLIHGKLAVITPGGQKCIVALDKADGTPVWSSQGFKAGAQYGSCYAFNYRGKSMIAAGTHGGIVCVDAANGRVLWSNPFSAHNTANCPDPLFSDGYVFWANGYGKGGICLKLSVEGGRVSAEQAWTTRDMVCHHGGYIIDDGYIYGNHSGGWACLELKTGRTMWNARGVGKGSLCYADGMLYLFSESGGQAGLATCSPQGLQIKGKLRVQGNGPSWAHPVVIGGRLYLRYESNLYCFDVAQPSR